MTSTTSPSAMRYLSPIAVDPGADGTLEALESPTPTSRAA